MPEQGQDAIPPRAIGTEAQLFAARLRPHRSLSRQGRHKLLAVFALLQGVAAIAFSRFGAWPVAIFLAVTWLGLVRAFVRNARDALAYEDIALSPLELHYARVSPAGRRRDWRFNPMWVRLAVERHPEFGVERLDFCARENKVEVGAFLGRGEKTRLAADLAAALAQARRGPRFS
jgi:uncharacterized membrane protein